MTRDKDRGDESRLRESDSGQGDARRARGGKRPIPVRDAESGSGRATGRGGRSPTPARARAPTPARAPSPTPAADAAAGSPSRDEIHEIAQVMFKGERTDYFSYRGSVSLRPHEYVIVEADRGQDLGWVRRAVDGNAHTCEGGCDHAHHGPVVPPSKKVIRRAAPVDVERRLKLDENEPEVRARTRGMVLAHKLKMKVSEAEWQWDRNKLTVYFTAEKRVDFRALVKEMARTFKTRIELRQIGVRDEAKRLGGIGRCGRELCCRLWLPGIEPVTLQLAKDQGLSLNPAQISGACGRLMSCLHYEHAFYVQAKKRFPKIGKRLRTGQGDEEVTGWDLFRETVSLRDPEGVSRSVTLAALKEETARQRRSRRRGGRAGGGSAGERPRSAP